MKLPLNILLLRLPILLLTAAILGRAQQQPSSDRDVSLKQLVPNILEDQKSMWSFPSRLAKGKDLIPTAAFAVIGTALVVGADALAARYFRNTTASTATIALCRALLLPQPFWPLRLLSTELALFAKTRR